MVALEAKAMEGSKMTKTRGKTVYRGVFSQAKSKKREVCHKCHVRIARSSTALLCLICWKYEPIVLTQLVPPPPKQKTSLPTHPCLDCPFLLRGNRKLRCPQHSYEYKLGLNRKQY